MHENIDARLEARRLEFLDACDLQRLAAIAKMSQDALALAFANVERLVRARINVQVNVVAKPLADIMA
jgi:hypothetical protein